MNKFAERLDELRQEKNLTWAELSRETNLSTTAFTKWIAKTRQPNIDSIIVLTNFFGCTAGYLIGTEN
jgi:transcriptional regulator with XRE-family HTH domain